MSKILRDALTEDGPLPRLARPLRLGIVGGGRIAATQAMAARMTGYYEVVAGALSSSPEAAIEKGRDYHIASERLYPDFETMARHEAQREDGVDAVMITTPNHLHFAAAKAFLEQGIAVMCDKPLVNEVAEADALVQLAKTYNVPFAVGYVMSCFAMIRQAREIVASGALGKLNQIHVEFMQDWMVPEQSGQAPHVKWRLDPEKSGKTSCVGDIGTHAAHLASFVTGHQLTNVRAEFHVCGAPKPLEDTVFMTTRFDQHIPGTLMATRLASGNRGGLRLRIYGDKGGLEWDLENCDDLRLCEFGKPDQILSRGHGHGIAPQVERLVRTGRGFPEGIIEAWGNLYAELAIAIAAKYDDAVLPSSFQQLPSVEEGAAGVRFVEAAFQSDAQGSQWVDL